MSIQIYQQKIYLIAQATNCNDLIKTLTEDSRKYNVDLNGLELEKHPRLDDIGIKETFNIIKNSNMEKILGLKKPETINNHILSVLETSAIEMGLILYKEYPQEFTIYPVPFLSSKSGIYNTSTLEDLKSAFGGKYNTNKYWERRVLSPDIDKNLPVIKTKVPNLNWKFTNEKVLYKEQTASGLKNTQKTISRGSLSGFMFNKFQENILYPIIREEIDTNSYNSFNNVETYNNESAKELLPIVILSNLDTIKEFLNQVKTKRFSSKNNKIERSSIWEIEMKVTKKIEYGKLSYSYNYINYVKRYPTEFVSKNLNKENNSYMFKLRGTKFELINLAKKIPIESVIKTDCKHCKESKKMMKIIKDIDDKINSKKNKKNNGKNDKNEKTNELKIMTNVKNFEEAINVLTE